MVSPVAGLAGLPLLALHSRRNRPGGCPPLALTATGRFALPAEGRFDLALSTASRTGPGWLSLVFTDKPNSRLLLLEDQVDASTWRELRLAIKELC
jgi:hypothetical protein